MRRIEVLLPALNRAKGRDVAFLLCLLLPGAGYADLPPLPTEVETGVLADALVLPDDASATPRAELLAVGQGAAVARSILESTVSGSRVFVSGHRASADSTLRIEGPIANLYGVNTIGFSSGANSSQNISVNVSGMIPGVEADLERPRADLSPSVEGRIGRGFEGRIGDSR
jgi:hypothetical protein